MMLDLWLLVLASAFVSVFVVAVLIYRHAAAKAAIQGSTSVPHATATTSGSRRCQIIVGKAGWARDVYSTFHKTPNRKKFSKEEWDEFTKESTRQSVAELISSPEFADWVIKNYDRIKLRREDSSYHLDESESCSSNGYVQPNESWLGGFFNWAYVQEFKLVSIITSKEKNRDYQTNLMIHCGSKKDEFASTITRVLQMTLNLY